MRFILFVFVAGSFCISAIPQSQLPKHPDLRIMFWNTENFYDTQRDSLIDDREFLPDGTRFWTGKRYKTKLIHTYKTIVALGGWEPPDIIGLCEIENRRVLNDIIYQTPLCKFPYLIVHKDSPDKRGIDVAMIYRKDRFRVLVCKWIPVKFKDHPGETTRDIVYVKGVTIHSQVKPPALITKKDSLMVPDTLHLFFNHWPSRLSGQMETDNKRWIAARTLKSQLDSILGINKHARIFVSGDFNDEPSDFSIKNGLCTCDPGKTPDSCNLVNLSSQFQGRGQMGTHKFKAEWAVLDQILVSRELLEGNQGLHCLPSDVHIFNADFLLVEDESGLGRKPFRTYDGYRYTGGFSDHLPVYLDLWSIPSSNP
jgi:Endonuclease/Exonuclease/phosphatase family